MKTVAKNTDLAKDQIRLDKWLWYARQTKSRSMAQKLITSGNVRVNSLKINSASKMVAPKDALTITLDSGVKVLKIRQCGTRRGPFEEAKTLYEDLSPPVEKIPYQTNAEKGIPTPHKRPHPREQQLARKMNGKI